MSARRFVVDGVGSTPTESRFCYGRRIVDGDEFGFDEKTAETAVRIPWLREIDPDPSSEPEAPQPSSQPATTLADDLDDLEACGIHLGEENPTSLNSNYGRAALDEIAEAIGIDPAAHKTKATIARAIIELRDQAHKEN